MVSESRQLPPIPREIVRSAKSIFGSRNFYILVGEAIQGILGAQTSERRASEGTLEPTYALITLFQALEGLTDVQAIDAVRTRLDWKYALHLPVHTSAIHEYALCEFRCRILNNLALLNEFHRLVAQLLALKPSWSGDLQDVKSKEVLSTVCSINYAESVHEAICRSVEILAVRFPDLLKKIVPPHWYGRYSSLPSIARAGDEETLIQESIADIDYLLRQASGSGIPELQELAEIKVLNQVRSRQAYRPTRGPHDDNNAAAQHCNSCPTRAAARRRKFEE